VLRYSGNLQNAQTMHKAVLINKVGPNLGKFGWNPTGDWITPKMCCQKEASRKAQNGYGNTGIQTAGLFSMEREYLKIHDFFIKSEKSTHKVALWLAPNFADEVVDGVNGTQLGSHD
jgi:hypothetical protein